MLPLADLPRPTLSLALLGALLLIAVGIFLGLRLARTVLGRRTARTRRLGRRGERRALHLLDLEGYRVLEREVTGRGRIEVDGRTREYVVRADALVRRRGRTWVAELKGGPEVSRVTHRETRRQILEYAVVFDVEGVLLVDGERGRIHHVAFPRRSRD